MNKQKEKLLQILVKNSFHYNEEKVFKLTSGEFSNYYIDAKATTLDPEGMNLLGNLFFDLISPLHIDAVGGLTLGADPISFAISSTGYKKGCLIKPFIVRKTAKGHGMKKHIEGNVNEKDRVIVIDDIITTGKSTLEAINKVKDSSLNIVKAIALVDRQEGGKENILNKEGIEVDSLFTKTDIMDMYERMQH